MPIKDLLNNYYPVLDYGFVRVVDWMGNDNSIVQAARVSYGLGAKNISDDRNLLRYMLRQQHMSPFEMCEIKFHIAMPIVCMRQWIRHRTQSVNEISGRYSVLPDIHYTPDKEQFRKQSTLNKQGRDELLTEDLYNEYLDRTELLRSHSTRHYRGCLQSGLAKELARLDMPLSTYTFFYSKWDLRNLLHMLWLRLDDHAQWEIRQYAQIIAGIVQQWVPLAWEAFVDYELQAHKFSRMEMQLLQQLFTYSRKPNEPLIIKTWGAELGMSDREIKEFEAKMQGKYVEKTTYELPAPRSAEFYEQQIQLNAVEA